jgi:glycosyltransferase involved in cell wall biosynthesis
MPWYAGGGFQYELVLLDALAQVAARSTDKIACLFQPHDSLDSLVASGRLNYGGLPLQMIGEKIFAQGPLEAYLAQSPPQLPDMNPEAIYLNREMAVGLRQSRVDWVFQLQPHPFGFSALVPFIMPIHDLQHRLQPEFKEVSANGQAGYREYLYRNACRYATLILVESESGRDDVLRFYGDVISEDRIRILPLYPPLRQAPLPDEADLARAKAAYSLPQRYFFYPAQFWEHKNHRLIVQALHLMKVQSNERVEVVFSGSYIEYERAHTFKAVMDLARELKVDDRVHYIGWVPDRDMAALYRLSAGLVMPTFFGPSNIPALEAWHYGRPVITSDLPGLREQTGDGGLLINPRSPEDLAQAMLRLWRDEALGRDLAERGGRRLAGLDWAGFVDQVADIVVDVGTRIREQRSPGYPTASL